MTTLTIAALDDIRSGLAAVDADTRARRQERRAMKAASLRQQADALEAKAARLRGVGGGDPAISTPAGSGTALGRAKARGAAAYLEAGRLSTEAERLRSEAADLDRPVRVRGDAERETSAKAQALDVSPGDTVFWFGVRKTVLKVNAKSVVLEGCEPIRVAKHLVSIAERG